MTSKVDTLKDKIYELEMELQELKGLKWCASFGTADISEMSKQIEEIICYIQYYEAELQYLEDMKYE